MVSAAYDRQYKKTEDIDTLVKAEYGGSDKTTRDYFYFRDNKLVGSATINIWERGTPEGDKYWEYFERDLEDVKQDHKDPGFVRRARRTGRARAVEIRGVAVIPQERGTGVEAALLQKALSDYPSAAIYALVRDPVMIQTLINELSRTSDKPQIFLGAHSIVTPGSESEFYQRSEHLSAYRLQMAAFLRAKGLQTKGSASLVHLNPADSPAYRTSLVDTPASLTPTHLSGHLYGINSEQRHYRYGSVSVATYLTVIPQPMLGISQVAA